MSDEDPQTLIEAKRALAVSGPPEEQVRLLDEIGDLYLKSLYDPQRAVGAWAEALELVPEDHRLLHKCLDAFVEDRAWPQALDMLEKLIAAEKSDSVRAKYHHTAGLILRDELKDASQAAAHLRAALDDNPELDGAARALEEVCKGLGEWNELGRLYRRRLKTLGPESPENADAKNHERLRIWNDLGDLCLRTLGEPKSAIAAFEAALSFDRDNLERQKQLADLYIEAGPDAIDKAVELHQAVLRREKSRVASYRALRALYARAAGARARVRLLVRAALPQKGRRRRRARRRRGQGPRLHHRAPPARRRDLGAPGASRGGSAHRLPLRARRADHRRRPRADPQARRRSTARTPSKPRIGARSPRR